MIERIELLNFKAHKQSVLEPKLLTILIGPNNSGKSSFFHAIQLLAQASRLGGNTLVQPIPPERTAQRTSARVSFAIPSHSLDVGTYDEVARGGGAVGISLKGYFEARVPNWNPDSEESSKSRRTLVEYSASFSKDGIIEHHGQIELENYKVDWMSSRKGRRNASQLRVNNNTVEFTLGIQVGHPFQGSGVSGETNPIISLRINHLLQSFESATSNFLRSIIPTYAIRGFEEHGYHVTDDPIERFDYVLLDDRSLALTSAFPFDRSLEEKVSDWLEPLIGLRLRVELVRGRKARIRTFQPGKNAELRPIVNEGLAVNQALFMLLPMALAKPFDSVLIEEPEAHLHPLAQSALAELFVRVARDEHKQLIMTTHSEHFLLAAILACRRLKVPLSELALISIEKDGDGPSNVRPLNVTSDGRIEGGLPGFFQAAGDQLHQLLGEPHD